MPGRPAEAWDLDMKHLDPLFDEHMQEAFGDRRQDFTLALTNRLRKLWLLALKTRTGDDMTTADEDAFITGVYKRTYPATGPGAPSGWGAPENRDRVRPPCRGCGGSGVGDYPYECHSCGGSGNG